MSSTRHFNPTRTVFLLSCPKWQSAVPEELPWVVVCGRSNVGKSSFINLLLRRKQMARVSNTPGRTQMLNVFKVDDELLLVDAPGYGFAAAPRAHVQQWSDQVDGFIRGAPGVGVVVHLLDIRRVPSADDIRFADRVRWAERGYLPVVTKIDKVARGRRHEHLRAIAQALGVMVEDLLLTSAKDGDGRNEVWHAILDALALTGDESADPDALPVIAIDGPSGAGKSTVARAVAARLGWNYLDTGAMYRSIGLKAFREGVALDDDAALEALCARTLIGFGRGPEGDLRIFLDGEDVSQAIREHHVSDLASRVSARKPVRDAMARLQRHIGETSPCVVDGRDMGTVVFPDARVKVFLSASAEERARRRTLELAQRGSPADFDAILKDINARDLQDTSREHAPLRVAEGATVIDTTGMTIEEVVVAVAGLVS